MDFSRGRRNLNLADNGAYIVGYNLRGQSYVKVVRADADKDFGGFILAVEHHLHVVLPMVGALVGDTSVADEVFVGGESVGAHEGVSPTVEVSD